MQKSCWLVLGLACSLSGTLTLRSATFEENFSSDPAQHGWRIFGEPSLFHWNSTNQNLEATWCSSNGNSYFYYPLGTVLAKDDDFSFSFDLRLRDIAIGTTPGKSETFQIAVGLINVRDATRSNYVRALSSNALNLAEFLYYPDSGWGATISTTLIDSNHQWAYAYMMQELTPSDLFHMEVNYAASNHTAYTSVMRNGQPLNASAAPLGDYVDFTDFRVDAFSISSYSDEGQAPDFPGSILAHGAIDNVVITSPEPMVIPLNAGLANGNGQVQFASRTNWFYRLQGTSDLHNWAEIASGRGNGGMLSLSDTNAHAAQFYRVLAERP